MYDIERLRRRRKGYGKGQKAGGETTGKGRRQSWNICDHLRGPWPSSTRPLVVVLHLLREFLFNFSFANRILDVHAAFAFLHRIPSEGEA